MTAPHGKGVPYQSPATRGMQVAVTALALELPDEVYEDVKARWEALLTELADDERTVDERLEALEERDKWPPCACAYDTKDDICAVHSPAVAKITDALKRYGSHLLVCASRRGMLSDCDCGFMDYFGRSTDG